MKLNKRRIIIMVLAISTGIVTACFLHSAYAGGCVSPKSNPSDLYSKPQHIAITGYTQDAMEPCISLDGSVLFFNNSNEANVTTHIHFAKRTGPETFRYMGILPGTESKSKDMAPTIDSAGIMVFTSLRSFDRDHRSLYGGRFEKECLSNVGSLGGDITSEKAFWINMDCGLSPDGSTLILSRAQFLPGNNAPRQAHLLWAEKTDAGLFKISKDSELILKNIDSPALEYAPAITADGLELYFTRACVSQPPGGNPNPGVEILVARRSTLVKMFNAPEHLVAAQGFVEAPSLTLDKKELYYHKKVNGVYQIWRLTRAER